MYTSPTFQPLEPHLRHFSFGEWERSLAVRAQLIIVRKRGYNIIFWKVFILKPNFSSEKHFHVFKINFYTHFTIFHFDSKHISSNLKNFFFIELSMRLTNQPWIAFSFFIQNSWKLFKFGLKHVPSWFNMKNSTCTFMFKIWYFSSKCHFCTWNSLFGLHDKHISFSIKSSHIFTKLGDHVQKISKFTFELSDCIKHFPILRYLLVTLHLPQPLTDDKDSKTDKMSSTHPNLNLSDVMDSMSQDELMEKKPFWDFEFHHLQHLNPNFTIDPNPQIPNFQYLSFCSSTFKFEDRYGKISINRIYAEKSILIFWVSHLQKSSWLFIFPDG